jgi:hypothetical protein
MELPQDMQNLAPSGFSPRQLGHSIYNSPEVIRNGFAKASGYPRALIASSRNIDLIS